MAETTTIQITVEQKQFLNRMGEASYKKALQILIDDYNGPIGDDESVSEDRAREIANEQITERVIPEAQQ